jgi:hypothetical protein
MDNKPQWSRRSCNGAEVAKGMTMDVADLRDVCTIRSLAKDQWQQCEVNVASELSSIPRKSFSMGCSLHL